MAEEMVGVRELHQRYGPPASWWYSRAEAGEIPSFKLGKYRRFRLADIERWIESQREGSGEAQKASRR